MHKDKVTISASSHVFELSKQGHNLLKARQFAEAHTVFEEALALDPENPYVLTGMGDVLRYQKDFSGATEYYRQVLKSDPHNLFSLRGLGDSLRGMLCYQEAIDCWVIYLRQNHFKDIFVLTRIADSYKTLNDYENALTYYQKVLALKPSDRFALTGLAELYHKQGLDLPAIEQYEKALANGANMISILTTLGNLYLKHKNHEKSRNYYEKTLQQDPHNTQALYGLGNYYRIIHDYQRAAELWEQILEKNVGPTNVLARLGDAYRNLGQFDAAERSYRKGLENGYVKFCQVGMMKLHCQAGRLKEACGCYDELLRHEGDDTRFFVEAGQLLIQRGSRDLALEFYRHVQLHHKNSSSASRIIADCILYLEEPLTPPESPKSPENTGT